MNKLIRIIIGLFVILVIVAIFGAGIVAFKFSGIQAGYVAQVTCSGMFVSNRNLGTIIQEDLADPIGLMSLISVEVDSARKRITASTIGGGEHISIYREGIGCTLLPEGFSVVELLAQPFGGLEEPLKTDSFWRNRSISQSSDSITSALDFAFSEPNSNKPFRTRAVVVVHKGKIIGERYGPGIKPETPLTGWSMTKSVTNALIGILVKNKSFSLEDPLSLPEWKQPDDPRRSITLDHLLRQSSGLEFSEEYFVPWSDINQMLWNKADTGAFAASFPLEHEIDSQWKYSSGTTNLISRAIKLNIGDQKRYFEFPRTALFRPLGMSSAIMEPDASGTFIGSSLMYASARDWTRFGILYLQDGVWKGNRILPEGWVKYSTTPTPKAPLGMYGAHFWLNAGEMGNPEQRRFPRLPIDLYFANGFQGQFIIVIPSKSLVIVRLGMSNYEPWPVEEFVAQVLASIEEGG